MTINPLTEVRLAEAQAALEGCRRLGGGRPVPVLVDARGLKYLHKEARQLLVSVEAATIVGAVALLTGGLVSRMIGSFFVRQDRHAAPTQVFTDEDSAIDWIEKLRR